MKKILALFSAFFILVWILPLGAFIKPGQQQMACGGKRAVHMCMMQVQKSFAPQSQGVAFTAASALEKNLAGSSGSGTDEFLIQALKLQLQNKRLRVFVQRVNFPQEILFTPPIPVPKF